jgi:predicted transcriptional regulator
MTKQDVRAVLERVLSWPPEQQVEAAELLLALEAREGEFYHPTDGEWAAVQEGLAEAERGEFVPDEEMEKFWRTWKK